MVSHLSLFLGMSTVDDPARTIRGRKDAPPGDKWRVVDAGLMLNTHRGDITHLVWYHNSLGIWELRFIIKPSRVHALDAHYSPISIGDGLFSARLFKKNSYLTYYDGPIVPRHQVQARLDSSTGAYLLGNATDPVTGIQG